MFNKRALPDEDLEQVPEKKRLRKDLVNCFLANDLSAKRTARIMKNAQAAGAEGLKDLQFKNSKNVSRDMLRKIFSQRSGLAPTSSRRLLSRNREQVRTADNVHSAATRRQLAVPSVASPWKTFTPQANPSLASAKGS